MRDCVCIECSSSSLLDVATFSATRIVAIAFLSLIQSMERLNGRVFAILAFTIWQVHHYSIPRNNSSSNCNNHNEFSSLLFHNAIFFIPPSSRYIHPHIFHPTHTCDHHQHPLFFLSILYSHPPSPSPTTLISLFVLLLWMLYTTFFFFLKSHTYKKNTIMNLLLL